MAARRTWGRLAARRELSPRRTRRRVLDQKDVHPAAVAAELLNGVTVRTTAIGRPADDVHEEFVEIHVISPKDASEGAEDATV